MSQHDQPTLSGSQLIAALRKADESVGIIGADHANSLASLAEVLPTSLRQGTSVELPGIGRFTPRESIHGLTVTFAPSPSLKASLNRHSAT